MANNLYTAIKDLRTHEQMTINSLSCQLFTDETIKSKDGQIKLTSDNNFSMITTDGVIHFKVSNEKDATKLADMLYQYPYNLASILSYQKEENLFFLHIAFFYTTERVNNLKIVIDDKVKTVLIKKRLAYETTFDSNLKSNFCLNDGNTLCYAYSFIAKDSNKPKVKTQAPNLNENEVANASQSEAQAKASAVSNDEAQAKAAAVSNDEDQAKAAAPSNDNEQAKSAQANQAEGQNNVASSSGALNALTEDDFVTADELDEQSVSASSVTDEVKSDSTELDALLNDEPACSDASDDLMLFGKDFALKIKNMGSVQRPLYTAYEVDPRMALVPKMGLIFGNITFTTMAQAYSDSLISDLKNTKGYLSVWDQYTSIEGDFLLQRARNIGLIEFNHNNIAVESNNTIRVYPKDLRDEQLKYISVGDQLSFASEVPVYLSDPKMTFTQYNEHAKELKESKEKPNRILFDIKQKSHDGSWLLSNADGQSLPRLKASLAIDGYYEQIYRRQTARERIASGQAANPSLGLLIEGRTPTIDLKAAQKSHIEPTSPLVIDKVFKQRQPRQRQKDAIAIALNTPDIALIQGPPGTGKTTVITAIIERLNEISDKRVYENAQVLISSFQHDAVRNVIERLMINSMPTPKLGRQGSEDISEEEKIDAWREDFMQRLKEKNPQLNEPEELVTLGKLRNEYIVSPTEAKAIAFLDFAKSICVEHELNKKITALILDFKLKDSLGNDSLLRTIRSIRTTKEGFLDDGPRRALYAFDDLQSKLNAKGNPNHKFILDTLDEASLCSADKVTDALLQKLSKARLSLIKMCTPPPQYSDCQIDSNVLDVYDELKKSLKKPQNEIDEILYDLLNEVEHNPVEINNTIRNYAFAVAATAQQSEGRDIRRYKNVKNDEHPEFNTVIIDEAARVNPGDLIIPMTQAKRRIILVGDHRQLPHIYDEEIFENMRSEGSDVNNDVITTSMFEYVKEKLEELEKKDGIKRTITLDAQYRMHPTLGNFVNDNFYKKYNEGFESPLDESFFVQKLCDKPYRWVDMPNSFGNETSNGVSRMRECEADYIVKTVKQYLGSEEGKDLSYGVITFYRAQKDLIERKLSQASLGSKVKVGSVDAFQGMEFDVIFLSVVRTHRNAPQFDEQLLNLCTSHNCSDADYQKALEYKEKIGNRFYGRLISDHLLCVSLSRQKKLLIVVGDGKIFHDDSWCTLAQHCVPAMANFYQLCLDGGMVIHGNT